MNISDIEKELRTSTKIEIEASPDEVKRYVNEQIEDNSDFKSFFDKKGDEYNALKKHVSAVVVDKAMGMFLLPALQIRYIVNQESVSQIRKAAEHLPTDLKVFYAETLGRISHGPKVDLARRVLMNFVMHALAIQPGSSEFSKDDMTTINVITSSCLGLVTHNKKTREVQLVHLSLKEYLLKHGEELYPDAELTVSRCCLKYLTLDSFQDGRVRDSKKYEEITKEFPFVHYANQCWIIHWQSAGDPIDSMEAITLLRNANLVNAGAQFNH
ncbi:MAG: hypothetical protein M1814_000580 [Vezdaea aestivalis]|nr:MAG: hypothetical protein M1814_000580 [Vezdaea aestivalis]